VNKQSPVLVALYFNKREGRDRVAEFRLNKYGRAELVLLNPEMGMVAQAYYDQGIPFPAEGRVVWPADGPAFMRALLQPFRVTYWTLVDESPQDGVS
jgi:hypothetical protein